MKATWAAWAPSVSVRVRMAALAAVTIGAVIVLAGVATVLAQGSELRGSTEAVARQQLASIRAAVAQDGLSEGALGRAAVVPGGESSYAQVVDIAGEVLAASPGASHEQPLVPVPVPGRVESRTVRGVAGEGDAFIAVAQRVGTRTPDSDWYVVVTRSLESASEATASTTRLLALGIPLILLAVAVVSYRLAGAALQPVERMRAAVADYSAVDLTLRVPEPPTKDELNRLAQTLNDMLGRLERSASQQQQFITDASHELRSPVASLRTLLEVARTTPHTEWDSVADEALAEVQRLQFLTSDLLYLARSEHVAPLRVRLDLAALVREAVAQPRRVNVVNAARTPENLDPLIVEGNPDALRRLLRNLLDNAERHAESTVVVSMTQRQESVTVRIADDGAGIPDQDRERVFDRFVRLDEARDRDSGGSGLGLAIARQIAHEHGGTLEVVEDIDTAPGAVFELRLTRLGPSSDLRS